MLLVLLLACTSDGGSKATNCTVDAAEGTAVATVDGEAWEGGGATWVWAGDSLQVNTVGAGSWWMSLVAQTTADGDTVKAAVDSGALPATIDLGGDGGWATLYPADGASYSSRNGSGELVIIEADDASVQACFTFEAAGDGDPVVVEDGSLDASAG
jgi:hypothetical protein